MSSLCMHARPQSLSPLTDSQVNDSLLQIISHFNEALLQLVDVTYTTFLYTLPATAWLLVVDGVQIWTVWRPEVRTDEVRCLPLQQLDGVAGLMCQSAVCARRRLTHLSWRLWWIILCTVNWWMPVLCKISRIDQCILTEHGLWHFQCSVTWLPIVPIFFNRGRYFYFWALVMNLSDRYFDWKNLCVNKILCNVVYSQNNMLLATKFVIHR